MGLENLIILQRLKFFRAKDQKRCLVNFNVYDKTFIHWVKSMNIWGVGSDTDD